MCKSPVGQQLLGSAALRAPETGFLADILDGSTAQQALRDMNSTLERLIASAGVADPSTSGVPRLALCLSVSFDGTQIFRHRVREMWPLLVTVLNLPNPKRNRLGVGTFITALLPDASGSNAEQAIFQKLFVQELKLLEAGIFVTSETDGAEIPLVARVVHHAYDTKALCKVLLVQGPGSRAGCPICRAVGGQHRSALNKVVHLGHRY